MLTAQYPLFDKASGRSSIVQSDLNGYNEFYFFLENEEYRPFDGCEIEILDKFTKYIFWFFEPFFARLASKFFFI